MEEFWQQLIERGPSLGLTWPVLTLLAAGALIGWYPSWRILRQVVTIAHEGAHALVAMLSGRRLGGVRLHADTSGVTVSRGLPRGPGMVATLAAGYPGPALLGILGAILLGRGLATLLLWVLLVILALLLVQIRNWFGLLAVVVSGAALFAATRYLSVEAQTIAAHVLVWFLLLAAPRAVLDLQRAHRRGRGWDSDAGQLSRMTPLPAGAWIGVFAVVTLGCAALGGWSLLTGAAQ